MVRLGIHFLLALSLVAEPLAALAQSAPANGPAPTQQRRPYRTLAERFEGANTTHDGHLTRAQAESGMPRIAEHFEEIDTGKQGFVTLDQVRAYAASYHRKRGDPPLQGSASR